MQLGTCKGGVEGEGSHCREQGGLALVRPDLAITKHLQAPKSAQAQDTAQGLNRRNREPTLTFGNAYFGSFIRTNSLRR